MFKRLFKKNTESTVNTEEIVVPCNCDGENEYCDLVLRLRECQSLKNEIEKEVEMLRNNDLELIQYFINFLQKLEDNGLYLNKHNKWFDNYYDSYMLFSIIENTISEYSSAYIYRMTEELKTCKNKADIICEKQRALRAVEDSIKDIKSKLGIE